jgi:hypothetical protein
MENKTGKYLKYAIGEIVLVVIGILIALSINNWNEKRKINQQCISILKNISDEIKSDQITVNTMLAKQKEKDKFGIQLYNFLSYKEKSYDTTALVKAFITTSRVEVFAPRKTAYATFQSSDAINALQSLELKKHLSDYFELSVREEDILVKFSNWTSDLNDSRIKYLPQLAFRNEIEAIKVTGNLLEAPYTFYKTIDLPWESIRKDSLFKLNLEKVLGLTMANQLMLKAAQKEQDGLLLLIDNYINNSNN